MKVVIVSGGFDPIHSGHISLLKEAKTIAGKDGIVIVGLNSNEWLRRKKGAHFLPFKERETILRAIKYVDTVTPFDDADGTACQLLRKIASLFVADIIFANGGDRTDDNIPELKVAEELGIKCIFGIGGFDKKNSSSVILQKWKDNANKIIQA